MSLEIQKYLRSHSEEEAVSYFENELGLKINRKDGFALFNYDQIKSPKDHPIVKESRGLILKDKTWELVLLPFTRFFNYGEGCAETIDLYTATIQSKEDGSLMSLWYDGTQWQVSTRKMMYAEGIVQHPFLASEMTFAELFFSVFDRNKLQHLSKDSSYSFELCTSYNRIVKKYDESKIFLLSARDNRNGLEYSSLCLSILAEKLGVRRPKTYSLATDNYEELKKTMEAFPPDEEGYVVVDEKSFEGDAAWSTYRRVKFKNPRYVLLHHTRMSLSIRNFIELIFAGEVDEFVAYFPEYAHYVDNILKIYYEFLAEQSFNAFTLLAKLHGPLKNTERKERARYIQGLNITPQLMYYVLDKPKIDARSYWSEIAKKKIDSFIKIIGFIEKLAIDENTTLNVSDNSMLIKTGGDDEL